MHLAGVLLVVHRERPGRSRSRLLSGPGLVTGSGVSLPGFNRLVMSRARTPHPFFWPGQVLRVS